MYAAAIVLAMAAPTPQVECSEECSSEFVHGCMRHHCDGDAAAAYHKCRDELDRAVGPLAATCDAYCLDTVAMAEAESTGCDDARDGDGGGGSEDEPGECDSPVLVKPSAPTVCTEENRGCCTCPPDGTTFVWWIQNSTVQRCLHTFNVPVDEGVAPVPVMLSMGGYGGGTIGQQAKAAALRYGFAVLGLGSTSAPNAAGFRLSFGNGGVANSANPTPCSAAENRDKEYTDAVFDFIEARPGVLDVQRVFAEGFSQNSMYAVYVTVCYADRVAGVWQGGSGLARTGWAPTTPGKQAQCSEVAFAEHGHSCCENAFCDECEFWPLWPRTCEHTVVDCIASYTDDAIACGGDHSMFEAMVAEGNDARLLSFTPTTTSGGHRDPENVWGWKVGCLGLAQQCDTECELSFADCVAIQPAGHAGEAFAACDAQMGSLPGCTESCAPTLTMLSLSEAPVVSLSQGRFGTASDLPVTPIAPEPACTADFGRIPEGQSCSTSRRLSPEPMVPCPEATTVTTNTTTTTTTVTVTTATTIESTATSTTETIVESTTASFTPAAVHYVMAPDGRCPDGASPIFDEAECTEAAAELKLFNGAPTITERRNRPAGCHMQGDTLSWAYRGIFSTEDSSRNALCAAVPPAEYKVMDTGRCDTGFQRVSTRLECEFAAYRLALTDVRAWQQDKANRAPGCSINQKGNLFFNIGGSDSNDPWRFALCVKE